jgi:hypothetical protein
VSFALLNAAPFRVICGFFLLCGAGFGDKEPRNTKKTQKGDLMPFSYSAPFRVIFGFLLLSGAGFKDKDLRNTQKGCFSFSSPPVSSYSEAAS